MKFDAATLTALATLLTVIGNFFIAWRQSKKLDHVVTLTNGQSEKLNVLHEKLGYKRGVDEEKRKA